MATHYKGTQKGQKASKTKNIQHFLLSVLLALLQGTSDSNLINTLFFNSAYTCFATILQGNSVHLTQLF